DITDITRKITIDDRNLPGIVQPDGKRCVKKIVYVNETVFEQGMDCHHKLKKKVRTTFTKDCHISFKPVVKKVKKCRIPYKKKCGSGIVGPEICRRVTETLCETTYKEYALDQDEADCKTVEEIRCEKIPFDILHLPHADKQRPFAEKERCEKWPVQKCQVNKKNVKKIHPDTQCKKIPRKICAPSNCQVLPGPEICNDETRTVIQNVPEEECDLQPQEQCRTESTLVPRLVPKKNCIKVPKDICVSTRKNPKTITKPVVKNWCYDPNELKKHASD
ncbi:Uncharacterized protein FKW44_003508, partial [Caligus rogercresseyi]